MPRRDTSSLLTDALGIYRLIRARPYTLDELAARLAIHQRTVRRIVDSLRAAGVEIRTAPRENGRANPPLEYRAGQI